MISGENERRKEDAGRLATEVMVCSRRRLVGIVVGGSTAKTKACPDGDGYIWPGHTGLPPIADQVKELPYMGLKLLLSSWTEGSYAETVAPQHLRCFTSRRIVDGPGPRPYFFFSTVKIGLGPHGPVANDGDSITRRPKLKAAKRRKQQTFANDGDSITRRPKLKAAKQRKQQQTECNDQKQLMPPLHSK
jgi:hypothetical protein